MTNLFLSKYTYRRTLLLLLINLFAVSPIFIQSVSAQNAQVKGVGQIEYSGRKPSKTEKRTTLTEAKLNAVERYVGNISQSKLRLFEAKRTEIATNIDKILLDARIVKEEQNKDYKTFRVVISGELSVTALDNILPAQSSTPIGGGEYLTFVFVARDQYSVKKFDDRKVAIKKNTKSVEGHDQAETVNGGVSQSAQQTQTQKLEVGGSVTKRASDVVYSVSTTTEINTAMSSAFTEAGFEVVDASYLENETGGQLSLRAFKRDYEKGEVSPATMSSASGGLRSLDIPFFAIGTLDASLPATNPRTGNPNVTVTVTAKIMSLKSRFPKTIASVGPVTFSEDGNNETSAKSNALKSAAESAASKLIAQLQSRNIH